MKRFLTVIVASLLIIAKAWAGDLASLSNAETVGGLKEALSKGAEMAVGVLGKENGFLGNEKVKIPLPDSLAQIEGVLRMMGMGKQTDELVTSMNRAAEAAVPEAKKLLLDAVKKMSVEDAKGILTGGDDAATAYFRKSTENALKEKFLPVVKKATEKTGLAQRYNDFASKAAKFGALDASQSNIENYVTLKALDGLYNIIAEEERAIRKNPLEQGGKLIGKVFGVMK